LTTALDIVTAALKKSGVVGQGQVAEPEDANDAFGDLNDMLAQWQRKRWLVYHLVDVAFTSTGAQSYTVGPGGNFNVARPDRVEAAFVRLLNATQQPDIPLTLLEARETYNRVVLKAQPGFPSYIFYDPAFPLGAVYPVWVPTAGLYEIHLTLKEQLGAFASLNSTVSLPPEYMAALKWNLTIRIHASYPGYPVSPEVVALARDSLNTIRNANAQLPELEMPLSRRGGRYNIYTNQSHS
jgi:hypothetical protein